MDHYSLSPVSKQDRNMVNAAHDKLFTRLTQRHISVTSVVRWRLKPHKLAAIGRHTILTVYPNGASQKPYESVYFSTGARKIRGAKSTCPSFGGAEPVLKYTDSYGFCDAPFGYTVRIVSRGVWGAEPPSAFF